MHLYEERFVKLLEHSLRVGSLAAQLGFTDNGDMLAYAPLLSVESWVRRDVGINVLVRCVGRLKVVDVQGAEPYITTLYQVHADDALTSPTQRRVLREQQGEVHALHDEVRALRTKLMGICVNADGDPDIGSLDEQQIDEGTVTWGHQLTRPESGFARPIAEQVDEGMESFVCACDKAKAGETEHMLRVETSDEERELAYTSHLACACFPTARRVNALSSSALEERMDMALDSLKEQRSRIAAKLSLVSALGTEPADSPAEDA